MSLLCSVSVRKVLILEREVIGESEWTRGLVFGSFFGPRIFSSVCISILFQNNLETLCNYRCLPNNERRVPAIGWAGALLRAGLLKAKVLQVPSEVS